MIESLSTKHPDGFDVPRTRRPQGVWKDWDRALGRVEPTLDRLWNVAKPYGVDVQRIQQEYAASEERRRQGNDGGSYEPVSAVEQQIITIAKKQRAAGEPNPVSMKQVTADYVAYKPKNSGEELIYPDTPGLVHRVYGSGAPTNVKTYGVSETWQKDFKVAGGRYDGFVESLSHTNKAAEQESYRNPTTGEYDYYEVEAATEKVVGVISVPEIAGIDDKVPSLVNGPDDFTGYLLRRPNEKVMKSQEGDWPEELTVWSLGQLVMDEGRLVKLENPVPDYPTTMPVSNVLYVPINYGHMQ